MELPSRASKLPVPLLLAAWAKRAPSERIEVPSVVLLSKMKRTSSCGIRNLPIVALPQLPCSPTNVSRLPSEDDAELPVSPLTFDSIWKIAFRPPPRLSVPRIPKRDELLLTRLTVGFEPSACSPLTNSRSIFRRPYKVTFAVCACTASGEANAPATARTTSFLFMESLL